MTGRLSWFLAALIGASVWAHGAWAAGPFGTIHVGNWLGGAYTDDKTGAFSHCAAITPCASGFNLLVGQNVHGAWLLGSRIWDGI